MERLIKALQIFLKYQNLQWPTHCEHDVLCIVGITFGEVSPEDRQQLELLGFLWSHANDCWVSYRYGSA